MIIWDRILNKDIDVSKFESPIILGRYIFKSDQSTIRLNDCQVKKHDFLVPCNYNEGILKIGSDITKLVFNENDLLNENVSSLIKNTLLDVLVEFKETDNILNWMDINILLRNFDERLEISEFELLLQSKLFHIEEICRQPSYYLKREITKLNVARAKRIPVKAINYLAAHTEDWSRRKIRSVEPRKILTEIIDYNLKIYENQVTVSFIDKLLDFFAHRLENEVEVIDSFVKNIERIIESRKRINSDEKIYWYKKLDRDYSKIGKAVDDVNSAEKTRKKVEKIKRIISLIQMRLSKLKKSYLYSSNSKNKVIINQKLKRTNLFDNHQHYRFVKILWDNFHKKNLSICSQKSEENQKFVRSYIDYSWLLLLRSLFQIGFKNQIIKSDVSIELTNEKISNITIKLAKNDKHIIEVVINGNETLTFVPIFSTKDNSIVFPDTIQNKYFFSLVGSELREDIIEISPTDINSEEKISKIIFKQILNSYSDNYLFKLDSQSISNFSILKDWLKNNNSLILDKGRNERIVFWLKRKFNDDEITKLESILNQQKNNLSARIDIRSKEIKNLNIIKSELISKAKEHFEKYEVCIRCASQNPSGLKSFNESFNFRCNNRGCAAEYGYSDTGLFFNVPGKGEIKTNLSKYYGEELSEYVLLNAFGYENI